MEIISFQWCDHFYHAIALSVWFYCQQTSFSEPPLLSFHWFVLSLLLLFIGCYLLAVCSTSRGLLLISLFFGLGRIAFVYCCFYSCFDCFLWLHWHYILFYDHLFLLSPPISQSLYWHISLQNGCWLILLSQLWWNWCTRCVHIYVNYVNHSCHCDLDLSL